LRIKRFLDRLKAEGKIADRQVRQDEEALRLYIGHFLKGDTSSLYPDRRQEVVMRLLGKIHLIFADRKYSLLEINRYGVLLYI